MTVLRRPHPRLDSFEDDSNPSRLALKPCLLEFEKYPFRHQINTVPWHARVFSPPSPPSSVTPELFSMRITLQSIYLQFLLLYQRLLWPRNPLPSKTVWFCSPSKS